MAPAVGWRAGWGVGYQCGSPDLLCQRHNPGFLCSRLKIQALFTKPACRFVSETEKCRCRDASVSSFSQLTAKRELSETLQSWHPRNESSSHPFGEIFTSILLKFGLFKCRFTATAAATKAAGTRRSHWHDRTPVNIPRCSCQL